jgi:hypothetical protein
MYEQNKSNESKRTGTKRKGDKDKNKNIRNDSSCTRFFNYLYDWYLFNNPITDDLSTGTTTTTETYVCIIRSIYRNW